MRRSLAAPGGGGGAGSDSSGRFPAAMKAAERVWLEAGKVDSGVGSGGSAVEGGGGSSGKAASGTYDWSRVDPWQL